MPGNPRPQKTRAGSSKSVQNSVVARYADSGNCVMHLFDVGPPVDYLDTVCVVADCWNACVFFLRISKKPFEMSGANASPIGRSHQKDERSECKPDAKRKRDSAQPQERAQPSKR